MIAKLRAILAEINRPSAHKDSWFSWASGQMAHAQIDEVFKVAASIT